MLMLRPCSTTECNLNIQNATYCSRILGRSTPLSSDNHTISKTTNLKASGVWFFSIKCTSGVSNVLFLILDPCSAILMLCLNGERVFNWHHHLPRILWAEFQAQRQILSFRDLDQQPFSCREAFCFKRSLSAMHSKAQYSRGQSLLSAAVNINSLSPQQLPKHKQLQTKLKQNHSIASYKEATHSQLPHTAARKGKRQKDKNLLAVVYHVFSTPCLSPVDSPLLVRRRSFLPLPAKIPKMEVLSPSLPAVLSVATPSL